MFKLKLSRKGEKTIKIIWDKHKANNIAVYINPAISIITLKVNGLNTLNKVVETLSLSD